MGEEERGDLSLDELRRAWRGLAPEDPADDLGLADARTRATVDWMRAAWSSVEAPAPPVHSLPAPRQRIPVLRLAAGLAAAAAVLLSLWFSLQRPAGPARSRDEGGPIAAVETPGARPAPEGPRLASISSEHIELRSGPVRLILLKDRRPQ